MCYEHYGGGGSDYCEQALLRPGAAMGFGGPAQGKGSQGHANGLEPLTGVMKVQCPVAEVSLDHYCCDVRSGLRTRASVSGLQVV